METEKTTAFADNIMLIKKAHDGDDSAVEELIKNNMGLVKKLALRFRDRGTDYEDLVQLGTIGMLKAIRTYDIERGTAFSTYAVPLIIGEIKKHLRDDGLIKVSRSYKKMGAELLFAKERYIAMHGREPSVHELAHEVGIEPEEAAISLEATSPIHSLSEHVYGEDDSATLESIIAGKESDIDNIFEHIVLSEAIKKMPPLWQKIVMLRYFRDMTQQKCAELLGISQVKISREEKKLVEFLRDELS